MRSDKSIKNTPQDFPYIVEYQMQSNDHSIDG